MTISRRNKVWRLQDLPQELEQQRSRQKRIVHCHGVFDLLHIGHIRHFEQAKRLGDVLVVTITPDRFVNKGAGRPAFPQHIRSEVIASLDCVDYVAINAWPTGAETIKLLRPHVFVKGSEYRGGKDTTGHIGVEEEAIRLIGGELAFTQDITYSSSALINNYLSNFSEETRAYLAELIQRYSADAILATLKSAGPLNVLCVGETIIDEYHSCEVMGKSGKEPVLAARYLEMDKFAGGVLACANHVASFCDHVGLITFLGEGGDQEAFVRGALKHNIEPTLLTKSAAPTIVKRRFVEKYLLQKLFEVYYMNDDVLSPPEDDAFCGTLREMLPHFDIVLVTDYGHGMFSPRAIETLAKHARYLAVNTQSNAGNNGLNSISKYPRADYVCLAVREYAVETRNRHMSREDMILHVARKLACPRLVLTLGKYGCLSYSADDGFKHVPAFATQVVDRVGAGDAVFCLTALCAAQGAGPEVIGFLGNVIGAEAVSILGNQRAIERIPLFRHVECLLKLHDADTTAGDGSDGVKAAA
jgi:rfaE bifunctional protein nucleotidyltransferase chain/domain